MNKLPEIGQEIEIADAFPGLILVIMTIPGRVEVEKFERLSLNTYRVTGLDYRTHTLVGTLKAEVIGFFNPDQD